jgi:tetratricopeptide (TPR) repeat protein
LLRQVYQPADGSPPRLIDRVAAFKLADIVGADLDCTLDAASVDISEGNGGQPTAEALLRRAECRPGETEDPTAHILAQYNSDAMAARAAGDPDTAIDLWTKALELTPDDTTLLTNLSYCAFEAGRLELTETTLRHLLQLQPDNAEARRNYGITLLALGREPEARPYLK